MTGNLREVSTAAQYSARREISDAQKKTGYIMAVIGAALFSLKAVIIKLAYAAGPAQSAEPIDPVVLLVLRLGFALPVYISVLIYILTRAKPRGAAQKPSDNSARKPGDINPVLAAILLGTLGYYLCSFLDFTGLVYITAQLERLLLFTYPAIVLILGALFFDVKITRYGAGSIAMAYMGIAVIFAGGDIATGENVVLGSLLILGCAVFFAIFQILAKPVIDWVGPRLFTCIAMISAGTSVFIHFLVSYGIFGGEGAISQALSVSPDILMLGAVLGLACTVAPTFLINIAIGRIGAQAVATIGMISPVLTIVAAVYVLGEPFGYIDGFGTVLTFTGIGLFTYFDKRK